MGRLFGSMDFTPDLNCRSIILYGQIDVAKSRVGHAPMDVGHCRAPVEPERDLGVMERLMKLSQLGLGISPVGISSRRVGVQGDCLTQNSLLILQNHLCVKGWRQRCTRPARHAALDFSPFGEFDGLIEFLPASEVERVVHGRFDLHWAYGFDLAVIGLGLLHSPEKDQAIPRKL